MGFFDRLFGKKAAPATDGKPRDVFSIQINDIVTYDLEDYQVVGKLIYQDGGFTWRAYQLLGEQKTLWLSVEMDDELELGMYESTNMKLKEPIPNQLKYDGITYTLDEKGSARIKGEGRSTNVDGMRINYYDFCDDDEESFLSVEIWNSEVEVSRGWEIEAYEIKILAAS